MNPGWREEHERLVMNDELERKLAEILGLSDPECIATMRKGVAEVREAYIMERLAEPRPLPAITERRLKRLERAIDRSLKHGDPLDLSGIDDLGVSALLRKAGVDFATEQFLA